MISIIVSTQHEHNHKSEQENGSIVDVLIIVCVNQEVVNCDCVGEQVNTPINCCWEPVMIEFTSSFNIHDLNLHQNHQNMENVAQTPPFLSLCPSKIGLKFQQTNLKLT